MLSGPSFVVISKRTGAAFESWNRSNIKMRGDDRLLRHSGDGQYLDDVEKIVNSNFRCFIDVIFFRGGAMA